MTTITKVTMIVAALLGIAAFLPNQDFVLIKIILLIGLLALIYYSSVGSLISKAFQVVIKDVREDRRDEYRKRLINNLKSLGTPSKLSEDYGEVGVFIEGKIMPESVFKQVKKCKIKAQLMSTTVFFNYTSLEAAGETVITIVARATANSQLRVEGLSETIQVGSSGSVSIKIPKSLYKKNLERGYIPAVCIKGSLRDEIQIPL